MSPKENEYLVGCQEFILCKNDFLFVDETSVAAAAVWF